MASYTVSKFAAQVGTSADTLRYYEREGLLPATPRTASGYRVYDDAARDRVAFIQGAQRLGLTLADIHDLLAVRDTGSCPCEPAEQHLTRRLAEVDAQIARLTALRDQMAAMLAALPSGSCPPPAPGTWCPPPADPSAEPPGSELPDGCAVASAVPAAAVAALAARDPVARDPVARDPILTGSRGPSWPGGR